LEVLEGLNPPPRKSQGSPIVQSPLLASFATFWFAPAKRGSPNNGVVFRPFFYTFRKRSRPPSLMCAPRYSRSQTSPELTGPSRPRAVSLLWKPSRSHFGVLPVAGVPSLLASLFTLEDPPWRFFFARLCRTAVPPLFAKFARPSPPLEVQPCSPTTRASCTKKPLPLPCPLVPEIFSRYPCAWGFYEFPNFQRSPPSDSSPAKLPVPPTRAILFPCPFEAPCTLPVLFAPSFLPLSPALCFSALCPFRFPVLILFHGFPRPPSDVLSAFSGALSYVPPPVTPFAPISTSFQKFSDLTSALCSLVSEICCSWKLDPDSYHPYSILLESLWATLNS